MILNPLAVRSTLRIGSRNLSYRSGSQRILYRSIRFSKIESNLGLRYYSNEPFKTSSKEIQEKEKINKLPKYKQWAIYFKSEEFNKSMTKYYVGGFICCAAIFYFYMRDIYYEERQIKKIEKKYDQDPKSLSEYEYLKLKARRREPLRPKERKKYMLYQSMRKQFRNSNLLNEEAVFNPTPQELEDWYEKQVRRKTSSDKSAMAELIDKVEEKVDITYNNHNNPSIAKPEDTTEFFEQKAAAYDDEIKWEERTMMLGKRRRWLMKQLNGDVLEVACGTGRNIPYFYPEAVDSITFLDSSQNMVELTQKKFREKYPKFKKAAFTVGKAEDLIDLTKGNDSVKYDTIFEAFGLCSHEDPVKALKNMTQLLKPGGRIVLLEHGRSNYNFLNNHLDFRAEKRMKTWACRWNLDIGEIVDESGLDITYEKRVHFGSTWMLVCKRPEDPIKMEEKPFLDKLFGRDPVTVKKE
ncbi:methyltransferase Oms1p, mitochondrial [[Candida] jaroonii]|uniref:Methyltransferase Oms1p, mitochondrial n=1 Tax=[Candida] jaroonii TaxID=467808 RepID=A0ACA9YDI0_9ASCO|nr:methyltransferase Oms1p, mitochondrial [[Candida] jaroonii]